VRSCEDLAREPTTEEKQRLGKNSNLAPSTSRTGPKGSGVKEQGIKILHTRKTADPPKPPETTNP